MRSYFRWPHSSAEMHLNEVETGFSQIIPLVKFKRLKPRRTIWSFQYSGLYEHWSSSLEHFLKSSRGPVLTPIPAASNLSKLQAGTTWLLLEVSLCLSIPHFPAAAAVCVQLSGSGGMSRGWAAASYIRAAATSPCPASQLQHKHSSPPAGTHNHAVR